MMAIYVGIEPTYLVWIIIVSNLFSNIFRLFKIQNLKIVKTERGYKILSQKKPIRNLTKYFHEPIDIGLSDTYSAKEYKYQTYPYP